MSETTPETTAKYEDLPQADIDTVFHGRTPEQKRLMEIYAERGRSGFIVVRSAEASRQVFTRDMYEMPPTPRRRSE